MIFPFEETLYSIWTQLYVLDCIMSSSITNWAEPAQCIVVGYSAVILLILVQEIKIEFILEKIMNSIIQTSVEYLPLEVFLMILLTVLK